MLYGTNDSLVNRKDYNLTERTFIPTLRQLVVRWLDMWLRWLDMANNNRAKFKCLHSASVLQLVKYVDGGFYVGTSSDIECQLNPFPGQRPCLLH